MYMKRIMFVELLLLLFSTQLFASEPTTMWPYLFDDFQDAVFYTRDGNKGEAKVNIHLLRNDLHYLKGSQIYSPDNQNDVARVILADSSVFVRCEDYFIEVWGETPQAVVGRRVTGDFDRLLQTPGAYGTSSSTSAVNKLSNLQIGGISNLNHDLIRVERENGETLPVTERIYFVVDGKLYGANKRTISKLLPKSGQKEFDKFLKENKIKWKEQESLCKVLQYVSPRLAQ